MHKIKVLIVDDSALVRQFLAETLSSDQTIEVTGTAIDPIFGFTKIMKDKPDVITLDVEMPRMDGLTFLRKLMKSYPIPVVMISSQTQKGCDITMKALELGAVDFITKPCKNLSEELEMLKAEVIRKVKNAARANISVPKTPVPPENCADRTDKQLAEFVPAAGFPGRPKLLVIGASTGGVTAVKEVLSGIDARSVSVLVVLHMPPGFTASFAAKLNNALPFPVKEAALGDLLRPGHIYVAPGGRNVLVEKAGSIIKLVVKNCDKDDLYRPSVDKTFISAARAAGSEAVAVILTGMGDDGARGISLLRQAGAFTIAQSKETSMIFGMPRKAIEMGGVREVLHLEEIAARVNSLICSNSRSGSLSTRNSRNS